MDSTIEYNWQPFVQGTDWSRTLVFTVAGAVVPLTDYTAKMSIRDEPHSGGNLIIDLSTTVNANGSVITITGASGWVTLTLTDVDTDLLTREVYYYDLKLTSPVADGSKEIVPIHGKMSIIPKVTV